MVACNKWDLVAEPGAALAAIRERIETRLPQIKGVTCLPLSVLTGKNLARLLPAVVETHRALAAAGADRRAQPLAGGGGRGPRAADGQGPPGQAALRDPGLDPPADLRAVREPGRRAAGILPALSRATACATAFDLPGVPLRLLLRTGDNPYA